MPKDVYLCFIYCAITFDNLSHIITEKKKIIYLGYISQYSRGITESKPPEHKYTNNVLYKNKGSKIGTVFTSDLFNIYSETTVRSLDYIRFIIGWHKIRKVYRIDDRRRNEAAGIPRQESKCK